jgi:hypothetical protein
MTVVKFEDKQGNIILATSSSIPGVMIVPPGMSQADAKPIKPDEFDAIVKQREKQNPKADQPIDLKGLAKAVADMQATIEKLKAKAGIK